MAIRSGAGTGVIVSLVVFVLATVFLLVLSIVFYANNREQEDIVTQAEDSLRVFASTSERGNDSVQKIVALAKESNQSVVGYLNNQIEQRNKLLTGNPSETLEQINADFSKTVSSSSPLAITISDLQSQIQSRQQELDARVKELASAHESMLTLQDELQQQFKSKDEEVKLVKAEWKEVQDGSKELSETSNEFFDSRGERLDWVRDEYIDRIESCEETVESLRSEKALLKSTVDDLRSKVKSHELFLVDPSLLIDGTVLEVGTGNEVFIDRGEKDHIILGMAFDVYDGSSQLLPDENNMLSRGKASIEIVKVGPTTSTAKITRSTPSQPIVRNNIIVNPVYDPNYKFSFIVHGFFDVDGDGNPEPNNSFVKDQILRWGGLVIDDDGIIPGDLDFLVLGVSPRKPTREPTNSTSHAMRDAYNEKLAVFEAYESLLEQAKAAQIPILTSNRLSVLTGQHKR